MSEVQPIVEFENLTPEQIQAQNREAFDYLTGLLDDEETKIIHDKPQIELKKEYGPENVIRVDIKSPKRDIRENPDQNADLYEETYFVSRDKGLIIVELFGDVRLKSFLMGEISVRKDFGSTRADMYEYQLLPAGKKSVKTAAKLIAETVKDYLERAEG